MRISPNFKMVELVRSVSWPELFTPPEQLSVQAVVNLCRLTFLVLQPLRDRFGPITITSGYRSRALNERVGGSNDSVHLSGRAADIAFGRVSAETVFKEIASGALRVEFDRMAWYQEQDRLHVEVSEPDTEPRRLLYIADPSWTRYEGDQTGEQA